MTNTGTLDSNTGNVLSWLLEVDTMTRDIALREAQKRWGKRAMIRAGDKVTSAYRREIARAGAIRVKEQQDELIRERDERLKALDWLQQMNTEIAALGKQRNELLALSHHYKFSVGSVDNIIGAFHIKGQGDTWEAAFDAAVGK
jgi:hypothetical protein